MQITIEYMLQFLGELLRQGGPAEDKVRLVEAFYNAALKHVNALSDGTPMTTPGKETEQEKRTKKEKDKENSCQESASGSLKAREPAASSPPMSKLTYLTPKEIRTKVDPNFLLYMDQTELKPKYEGLMSNMVVPLSAAQYLSWLTRYPKGLIDNKLMSLEKHPTHYGKVNVAGTINDWIRQDAVKMTSVERKQWNDAFRQQQPLILEMINQHLKPKRNAKQTTIDFDAAGTADAATATAAAVSGGGGAAAVHTDDHDGQPGVPDAQCGVHGQPDA